MPAKDTDKAKRVQEAFELGARARAEGNNVNPYEDGAEYEAWAQGWLQDEHDQHG